MSGHPKAENEPIKNMHPDLQHIHDWEGLHPAVRPLLNHTDNSSAEERRQRIYHLADHLIREHTPALLDLHPELKEHTDALRALPPLRTASDFKKACSTINKAQEEARGGHENIETQFYAPVNRGALKLTFNRLYSSRERFLKITFS